jgi:hypothetical protein
MPQIYNTPQFSVGKNMKKEASQIQSNTVLHKTGTKVS